MEIITPSCIALIGSEGRRKRQIIETYFSKDTLIDESSPIPEELLNDAQTVVFTGKNFEKKRRKEITDFAKKNHMRSIALIIEEPLDNLFEYHGITHSRLLEGEKKTLGDIRKGIGKESFKDVFFLQEEEEIIKRRLPCDKQEEHGPFDIIGDVHGCRYELEKLLKKLGYEKVDETYVHPEGRKAVFLGDVIDRGTENLKTLKLIMKMCEHGSAYMTLGNHDDKLYRYLCGNVVVIAPGQKTYDELKREDEESRSAIRSFLEKLPDHLVFDEGRLVCVHAGIKQKYILREGGSVHHFCLYGESTGEYDSFNLPVRLDWTLNYDGDALVVYGHTPYYEPRIREHCVCVDTGCVFGNKLTAYRYPEGKTVSTKAKKMYYERRR